MTSFTTTRSNNTCYKQTFQTVWKEPCQLNLYKSFGGMLKHSVFFYCAKFIDNQTLFFIKSLSSVFVYKLWQRQAGFSHAHGEFVYLYVTLKRELQISTIWGFDGHLWSMDDVNGDVRWSKIRSSDEKCWACILLTFVLIKAEKWLISAEIFRQFSLICYPWYPWLLFYYNDIKLI